MTEELHAYSVISYHNLSKSLFPFILPFDMLLISFTESEIANPNSDIIAIYYKSGIRMYLWRDKEWTECYVSVDHLIEKCDELKLSKIEDLKKSLHAYKYSKFGTPNYNNPSIYYRMLCLNSLSTDIPSGI